MKKEEFDWKSQFREWLKEIIPWDKIAGYVQFVHEIPEEWVKGKMGPFNVQHIKFAGQQESISIRVFTKEHKYRITANKDYLGCCAASRKARAGEDWTRGNDLPDGKFNRETWEKIKDAILRYEMVRVMKPQQETADDADKAEGWDRHHSRYSDKSGKLFYAEWLQRGDEIREHKVYELVGESS